MNAREELNQAQAVLFAKRMYDAWSVANSHITLDQKERDISKHRRLVDYKPGDKV
jgi:hypothetical protein